MSFMWCQVYKQRFILDIALFSLWVFFFLVWAMELENLNPNVYKKSDDRKSVAADWDDSVDDPFDEREIFGKFYNVRHSFRWFVKSSFSMQSNRFNTINQWSGASTDIGGIACCSAESH